VSTRSSSNIANKGYEFVAIAVQQISGFRPFPQDFENAVVTPLLKKDGLDTSQMKNYRPVSNFQTFGES